MAENQQSDSALSQLQSSAQVELLDAIDQLRLHGFQGELDPPRLIVCGDQSSGKSSVLEAISRYRFPSDDEFCTRFASELVLRRSPDPSFTVIIVPAEHRNKDEKGHLSMFEAPPGLDKPQDFGKVIALAKDHILELDPDRKCAFYKDKLVATIRGPEMLPLTLVDLPGLIHSSNKSQSQADIATVQSLVTSYMAQPNTVILAVLAADNNLACQVVLELARNVDPRGHRTLGIITKPDRVHPGGSLEGSGVECAQNQNINLELGWHVLRNCGPEDKEATPDERDALETDFFSRSSDHNWKILPDFDLGASALRGKLSRILLRSVQEYLPTAIQYIRYKVRSCETNLQKLGQPKESEAEQRAELTKISVHLNDLIKAGVQGNYCDTFFDHAVVGKVQVRRLRAQLREALEKFQVHISCEGHRYEVVDDMSTASTAPIDFHSDDEPNTNTEPTLVSRQCLLDEITKHIKKNRGCELDGLYPSEIVRDVFRKQSSHWESITNLHLGHCTSAVREFFSAALQYCAPQHIAQNIHMDVTPSWEERNNSVLQRKLNELLKPYRTGHLITLNTELLPSGLTHAPSQRLEAESHYAGTLNATTVRTPQLNPLFYNANMDAAACRTWEYANAFYDIALHTFMDNVATLAVEHCIVEHLLDIFTPMTVAALDAETIRELTAEPENVQRERSANRKRLETLREILQKCEKHVDRSAGNIPALSSRSGPHESLGSEPSGTGGGPDLTEESTRFDKLSFNQQTPRAANDKQASPDESSQAPVESEMLNATQRPATPRVRRIKRRNRDEAEKSEERTSRADASCLTPPKTPQAVPLSVDQRTPETDEIRPSSSSRTPSGAGGRGRLHRMSPGYNSGPGTLPSHLQTWFARDTREVPSTTSEDSNMSEGSPIDEEL